MGPLMGNARVKSTIKAGVGRSTCCAGGGSLMSDVRPSILRSKVRLSGMVPSACAHVEQILLSLDFWESVMLLQDRFCQCQRGEEAVASRNPMNMRAPDAFCAAADRSSCSSQSAAQKRPSPLLRHEQQQGMKRIFRTNRCKIRKHGNFRHHQADIDGLWVSKLGLWLCP